MATFFVKEGSTFVVILYHYFSSQFLFAFNSPMAAGLKTLDRYIGIFRYKEDYYLSIDLWS
jgi:hypothetical protein